FALLMASAPAIASERTDPARLSAITRELASDAYGGRAPGTPGEGLTVAYLEKAFRDLGLEPAGEGGRFTQAVPMIRTQLAADGRYSVAGPKGEAVLASGRDISLISLLPVDRVSIEKAPMVFVGYGVTAPERGWDDFKGVDLKGKVAVFLINDPDFEAAAGDPVAGKFGGRAATYYARWTYKFEEAVRRGAVAALIVHQTEGAGYGWSTVLASAGEGFDVARRSPSAERLPLQGWLSGEAAARLFASAGLDLESLRRQARSTDFRPVDLKGLAFSASAGVTFSRFESRNVIARLPGRTRPDESLMIADNWDAYGEGPPDAQGRRIRPGAVDDALGVAGVLEAARVLKAGRRPDRSVLFALWTAEERGLLGSEHFGAHPTVALEKMAANLTLDVLQTAGPARDVVLVGAGQSELDDLLASAARRQKRTVTPDARPERALFFRADHFSLARRGVPALLLMGLGGGADLVQGGRAAGDAWVTRYTDDCYHKTCDAWSADWDLRGAAADVDLVIDMARTLARPGTWPDWRPGSEFRDLRDRTASARRR
ncbi:MAG: M28 family metallopeptidase, partial [Phenylobacterium sp.]